MKSSNDAGQSLIYPLSLHPPSDFSWPLFLTLFPKIILLCNVLSHIPTLIQSNEVVDDPSTTSHLLPLC
ncbi:hypothetical protein ACE6H2_010923 [Prunus campanulata]